MSPKRRYEIFQKTPHRQLVWVESATGLNDAKLRIKDMEQMFPVDYLIFDLESLCFIVPLQAG
jgi:hypothetical protein